MALIDSYDAPDVSSESSRGGCEGAEAGGGGGEAGGEAGGSVVVDELVD